MSRPGLNTVARGANIIWQAITPNTSIPYGIPDPSGFFAEMQPPPLVPGVRYNWIVLNNYGNNPALTSSVTSGPAGFSVDVPLPFDPPTNLVPEPGASVAGQTITFSWTPVQEATLYHIYISKYDTFGVKTVEDYSKLGPEEKAQWLTAHVIEYPTKMLQH